MLSHLKGDLEGAGSDTGPIITALCFIHLFLVADRIRSQTLSLAYRAVKGSGPSYTQDMVKTNTPGFALFATLAPKWLKELKKTV